MCNNKCSFIPIGQTVMFAEQQELNNEQYFNETPN